MNESEIIARIEKLEKKVDELLEEKRTKDNFNKIKSEILRQMWEANEDG